MDGLMADRVRAFLVHLACSAAVALTLAGLVFGVWYPVPLDMAVGVREIFLIVLCVDATLGPLITLVIYRKGKKGLAMDLAVVVILQVAALLYGVSVVAEGRPVWIVFNVDRFDVAQATEISGTNRDRAAPEYQGFSWTGPKWVGAAIPEDPAARTDLMFEAALGGADLPHRPDLYRPLSLFSDAMRTRSKPMEELRAFNNEHNVARVMKQWPAATSWLPLSARNQDMTVLLDGEQQVVAVVDLRPWAE
ncbi:TfpX/TfpZ family type IV pilin accessory protein [Denitratimonas sp. CY0512]|uniref:TfpX/TfpZ family type IV pilin accessory protein n=1 Tax=Denitratimonas sp. CY0512 TaxID=3131940 RepID=UPI00309CD9F2